MWLIVDRREFLKLFSLGTLAAMGGQIALHRPRQDGVFAPLEDIDASLVDINESIHYMTTTPPDSARYLEAFQQAAVAEPARPDLESYLRKMENFESAHYADVYLEQDDFPLLITTFKRMERVQNLVGHGNFNVIAFDEMVKYAQNFASVGEFTAAELTFFERMFEANAEDYGFFGDKVIDRLSAQIPERERVKIARTGHFLYRGESERLYEQLRKDIGPNVVLTSGIRGVVKQTYLFLAKTIQAKGNLSRASRSLAPPGHSYHGIGDFDVGKIGLGRKNFTDAFAYTDEFRRLVELGYIDMRYPRHNLLGVRYEPWHIKVV